MSILTRRPLTLLPVRAHPGGRTGMTCHYKCGDACTRPVENESENEYFGDVFARSVSRRRVLQTGGLTAALVGFAAAAAQPAAASGSAVGADPLAVAPRHAERLWPMGFCGIAPQPATTDMLVVPKGWTWRPVIRWGDPLFAGSPEFDFAAQSEHAQEQQFGYNNDYTVLIKRNDREATLVCNHEYTNDELMFPVSGSADLSDEQLRTIIAAHGLTVVDVRRRNSRSPWTYVRGGAGNRRITGMTPFHITGPAAGSRLLRTGADPSGRRVLGTLNNCSGGLTPWGTVLSGEENIDQYFKADTLTPQADEAAKLKRYGLTTGGRGWERVEPRFDVAQEPNEANRFGWVVEIDPDDPEQTHRARPVQA